MASKKRDSCIIDEPHTKKKAKVDEDEEAISQLPVATPRVLLNPADCDLGKNITLPFFFLYILNRH